MSVSGHIGEAMAIAVRYGMTIRFGSACVYVASSPKGVGFIGSTTEDYECEGDELAALRRAIFSLAKEVADYEG
jgi:hypothetical protein